MEVVDQKGYKYNYANYDFGLETIKIIKPSGTRLVFSSEAGEVDIRLIQEDDKKNFSIGKDSIFYTYFRKLLEGEDSIYFVDTTFKDKALFFLSEKEQIILTMESVSKDRENKYAMHLKRGALKEMFHVFGKMEQEEIGKEKETELEQHNKVMKKSYT